MNQQAPYSSTTRLYACPMLLVRIRLCVFGSVLLIVALLLVQCARDPSIRQVTWELSVPDNYHGFLVIMYDCLDGDPLPRRGGSIMASFSDEGVICTSDQIFGWTGEVIMQTRSGRLLPGPILWDASGYGFYGAGSTKIHGSSPHQFEVYWVGDLAYLASIRNTAAYRTQLNSFLSQRFGITMEN